MIAEFVRAGVIGGLPVALFTLLVLQWAVASGRIQRFADEKDLQRQYKDLARENKRARKAEKKAAKDSGHKRQRFYERSAGDLFHDKVMFFGSGFYGTMAIFTYLLIELLEIWQFLLGVLDPETWINRLGLQLLIDFLINTITNLVAAFIWFSTLPEYVHMNNRLIWLAAAYGGYLAGVWLTREHGDRIWAWLSSGLARLGRGIRSAFPRAQD